jgi:hypothetical protein
MRRSPISADACFSEGSGVRSDARLFPAMTVEETIGYRTRTLRRRTRPVQRRFRLPMFQDSEAAVQAWVDELIELLGLGAYRSKFVRDSTGSRRGRSRGVAAHGPSGAADEPSRTRSAAGACSFVADCEVGPACS